MGTEGIKVKQEMDSCISLEMFSQGAETYRRPYELQNLPLLRTGIKSSDKERTTSLSSLPVPGPFNKEAVGIYKETIREWWYGKIVRIDFVEKFFEADLQDIAGLQMITEFDFNVVFEGLTDDEISRNLYNGSEFIYYVTREHGHGAPSTRSSIEFIEPYIWTMEDEKKVKEKYDVLLHNDPFDDR